MSDSSSPQDARVDDLRQQLRALGYLDAGVDRFVLGPARARRRPSVIALLASLRIGVLAGVLLGPSAAIGIGARMPGLVIGLRDSIVAAIYIGVLFGAIVWGLAFVTSVVVARVARERAARLADPLSRAAGVTVTLACLTYLTLWWRNANAGLGWSAPLWTACALAVAVAVSLLLGHAVRLTALAVMAADQHEPGPPRPRTLLHSWTLSVLGALVAFLGAAALLIATASRAPRPDDRPLLPVVPSGIRVRLIAIDGFDPDVLPSLASTDPYPALAKVLSSTRARLAPQGTRDPAAAWTTIATGQPPDVHGVHSLETRRVAGLQGSLSSGEPSRMALLLRGVTDLLRLTTPAVASGSERREKTIWEVASDAGLRTAVVNWWATWPAASQSGSTHGIVLSDRATLRLEHGGTLDAEIEPAELYEHLKAQWPDVQHEAATRVSGWLQGSSSPEIDAVLKRSAEIDAIQLGLADRVASSPLDLLAVYLPGLDIAQHVLLAPGGSPLGASAVTTRVLSLQRYYLFLSRAIESRVHGDAELLVVVTGSGRGADAGGLLAIAGPHARGGAMLDASAVDVAPTILHALGVPISRELAGQPLVGLFDDPFNERYPVREVAGYGRRAVQRATRGQPLDQEMIDRLRSLGYVR